MSMNCWKCNTPTSGDFCSNCGSPVSPNKSNDKPPAFSPMVPPRPSPPVMAKVQISAAPTEKKGFFGRKKRIDNQKEEVYVNLQKKSDLVVQGLKKYYSEYIRPLEKSYQFHAFHSSSLNDIDFDCPPMVLLLGQYSTGKTSFIQYMIEKPYAGMRIGPEPTTDRFTAIVYNKDERIIPGHALAAMEDQPFRQLQQFGASFLNHMEAACTNSPILKQITFIDCPGILSGEAQRINRNYDFPKVARWFADRCDRILLLFDTAKLDISDEYKNVIQTLVGHEDKVRCILNKADCVSAQELMRVYGSLLWSLGRVIKSPEVLRVYVGSFWAEPYKNQDNASLLQQEEQDLLTDLKSLPRNSAIRRVNDLVKRTKQLRVHMLIIEHLRSKFGMFGKKKKQEKLLANMLDEFTEIHKKYGIPHGDFPHMGKFVDILRAFEIWQFPELNKKKLEKLDWVLSVGIPELLSLIPSESEIIQEALQQDNLPPPPDYITSMSPTNTDSNPFDDDNDDLPIHWAVAKQYQDSYKEEFYTYKSSSGKLSAAVMKPIMMKSTLGNKILGKIWSLSDIDKDGSLDLEEFVLCMSLINVVVKKKVTLPEVTDMPVDFVPPTKREIFIQRRKAEGIPITTLATHPHYDYLSTPC